MTNKQITSFTYYSRRQSDSGRRQDSAPIVRNERFASLAGDGDRDRDRDNRGGGDRDRPSDRDRGDNRGGDRGDNRGGDRGDNRGGGNRGPDEGKLWGNKSDAPAPRRSEGSGSNEGGWR
jgi:hypothetical protein